MKITVSVCALIGGLIAAFTLAQEPAPTRAAPADKPEKEPCSANLEVGKKYHWVTYVNGQPQKSGYVQFTPKKHGKWHKVVFVTDRPKSKKTYWGFFNDRMVSFKNKQAGERWTAWMKVCEGAKIRGNVYRGKQKLRQFDIVTDKVRD
jgi:hypothetical protein